MSGKYEFKGTAGPWRWEVNENARQVQLCGGIRPYDLIVMDFKRWGFQGAAPRFNTDLGSDLNVMEPIAKYTKVVEGREHHARWFKTIDHPDAQAITAVPDLITACINALETTTDKYVYDLCKKAIHKALNIEQ